MKSKVTNSQGRLLRIILMAKLLCTFSLASFGQGWALDVEVNLNHVECAIEQLQSASVSFNGFVSSSSGPFSGATTILRIVGTGSTSGTLTVNANGNCIETYYPESTVTTISASHSGVFNFSSTCVTNTYYQSSSSNPSGVSGSLVFYPKLVIASASSDCTGISLSVNPCQANSLTWEFSSVPASNWYPIAKNGQSISVTPSDLFNSNFASKFGKRSIRATSVTGTTSDLVVVDAWAPGPNITSVVSTSPDCHDGSGNIAVTIDSQNGAWVNDFVLSLYNQSDNLAVAIPIDQKSITDAFAATFLNVGEGTYKIQVQNNTDIGNQGSCLTLVQNSVITLPPVFSILAGTSSTPVSCNANDAGTKNDGSITINLQNGAAPYSYFYSIDGGDNFFSITPNSSSSLNPVFNGLTKANYIFQAKYTSGSTQCVSNNSSSILVSEPSELSPAILKTDLACRNQPTGAINFEISGGNGGYTYSWTGPNYTSSDQDVSSLLAGTYQLTVTDAKGCRPEAVPIDVPILQPDFDFTITPSKTLYGGGFDMTCAQDDGEVSLILANHATPLQSVTWKKDGSVFSPLNPLDATNLSAASYSVDIIDGKGCNATASISLNPHPGITVITQAVPLYNGFHTKCSDSDEGEGQVLSVTNGFGSYTYAWFDGSANAIKSDLSAGTYSVTVSDGNGCADSEVVVITSPPAIQPHLQITSNYNGTPISCPTVADGRMEAFPVNGYGTASGANYHYEWSHSNLVTTKFAKDLVQGVYKVIVTDDYGCSAEESLAISDPIAMSLSLSNKKFNGADLSCFDGSDGEIQLTVANGATPYSYVWSDGKSTKNNTGIKAGTYTVTVTDANSCEQTESTTLINPNVLSVVLEHVNDFNGYDISCRNKDDGAALAVVTGGTGAYTYAWSNGTNTINNSNLLAGSYSIEVIDANNCRADATIDILQPSALNLNENLDNPVSCFGGSDAQVTLTGSGGVAKYKYSIDPLDALSWQTQAVFASLSFGSIDFYVRDGNGCIVSTQMDIPQPDVLELTFKNIKDATCNNPVGAATAMVNGGNGDFVYSWFDQITNQKLGADAVLQNVIAGVYGIDVTDAKNCRITDQVAISSIGGASFTVDTITGVSCYGFKDGASAVSVSSGSSPYSYLWSDGQSSSAATGLAAGKYFITITDGLGCKTIQQVDIPTPKPLTAEYSKAMPLCTGDCNGRIEVFVNGGTVPYQYDWNVLSNFTPLVSNVCAGIHDLTVSDAQGCKLYEKVELNEPSPVKISSIISNPNCLGRCDGSITVTGSGGTGSYSFAWDTKSTSAAITNLCPGDYNVQMTDSNNCAITDQYTVFQGPPLPLDLGIKATLCVGQVKILDPGAQWAISSWTSNNGFTNSSSKISIKDPGLYYFKGIDAMGCIAMDTFKLETSLDLLKAEFLMPTEIVVGDTLVAIDISWPLPERIEWSFPSSFKTFSSVSPEIFMAQPQEPGIFSMSMRSFLAECRDLREKTITVLADRKISTGGRLGYDELIKEFSVYPNPNDGDFSVLISLDEEKMVRLKLIQFPTGIVVADYSGGSSLEHRAHFELPNIPAGMYVVLLEVDSQQRFIRFMKQ